MMAKAKSDAPQGLRLRKRVDASVEHEGEPAKAPKPSVTLLEQGRAEGWIAAEGERVVHRPGGPAADPWRKTWTFRHYDAVTIAGVRYAVVAQPDKYGPDGEPVTEDGYAEAQVDPATRVDTFYTLELAEG